MRNISDICQAPWVNHSISFGQQLIAKHAEGAKEAMAVCAVITGGFYFAHGVAKYSWTEHRKAALIQIGASAAIIAIAMTVLSSSTAEKVVPQFDWSNYHFI